MEWYFRADCQHERITRRTSSTNGHEITRPFAKSTCGTIGSFQSSVKPFTQGRHGRRAADHCKPPRYRVNLVPSVLVPGGALRDFRNSVGKEHRLLDFRGIGMPLCEPQPIDAIFVDVTLRDSDERGDECRPDTLQSPGRRRTRGVSSIECLRTQDRVIVLGHPGSGKTTLLRYLAFKYATQDKEPAELPIYVRLAEYSRDQEMDEGVDFISFAAARRKCWLRRSRTSITIGDLVR